MSFFALVAGGEEAHTELPMAPWMYGAIALVVFALLLAVLWSFRNTAQKVAVPGSHEGDHGTTAAGHH